MKKPGKYLARMSIFVVIVAAIAIALSPTLKSAFLSNAGLNGVIVGTLLIGIFFTYRRVFDLNVEIDWILSFQRREGGSVARTPKLLAAAATMLEGQQDNTHIRLSNLSTNSLLDGVAARLDESREISRYLTGLLVFLGLLGTFWGLLGTIGAIGTTINSLSVDGSDTALMFDDLKTGLQAPLSGMGTAFSSSLFGLAGSLVLGFLDLQASQAQSRFYNDLEDWLSSVTQLSRGEEGAGGSAPGAYGTALMEQTADGIDRLERTLKQSGEDRITLNNTLADISSALSAFADNMASQQASVQATDQTNKDMISAISKLVSDENAQSSTMDEAAKGHLRNIDVGIKRLLEEQVRSQEQLTDDLRSEIKLLSRTMAAGLDALDSTKKEE